MSSLTKGIVHQSIRHEIGNARLQEVVDENNQKWFLLSDMKDIFGSNFRDWYILEKDVLIEKTFPMLKEGKSAEYLFISLESVRHILENPKKWYRTWLESED